MTNLEAGSVLDVTPQLRWTPKEQRQVLIDYLLMKVQVSDWHAVSDAANDLRELEAKCPEVKL